MKRLLLLILCFVGLSLGYADNIVKTPTAFDTGSSFTIRSGVHATFASGSVVDFTGATVSGLPYVNSTETSVVDGNFVVFSGTGGKDVRKASPFEVFDYGPDDGISFIPYWNTAPGTHIWDKLPFSDNESLGLGATTVPSQRAVKVYVDGQISDTIAYVDEQIALVGGGGSNAWVDMDFTGSDFADIVTHPTTLAGYGITDAQPLDGDLTALAAANSAGLWYKTGVSSAWAHVTIGTGLDLTGGTLSSTVTSPTIPSSNNILKGDGAGNIVVAGFTMPSSYTSGQTIVASGTNSLAGTFSPTVTNMTVNGGALTFSGNQNSSAWTTFGLRVTGTGGTLTDTSSSGTVASGITNRWSGNTIAAGSAVTFTNYTNSYYGAPVAGSNVTITNPWAIWAESAKFGTGGNVSTIDGSGIATLKDGAVLGTPGSMTATNVTGTAAGLTAGNATTAAQVDTGVISTNANYFPFYGALNSATAQIPQTNSSLTYNPNSGAFSSTTVNAATGFKIGGVAASRTIPVGNGTNFVASTETYPTPSTAGNFMYSDGTNWTSVGGAYKTAMVTGSDYTNSGSAFTVVIDSGTLTASTKYEVIGLFDCLIGATTSGMRIKVGDGGSGTGSAATGFITLTNNSTSATAIGTAQLAAETQSGAALTYSGGNGSIQFKGFITTRSTGSPSIAVSANSVDNATQVTIKQGSTLMYRKTP